MGNNGGNQERDGVGWVRRRWSSAACSEFGDGEAVSEVRERRTREREERVRGELLLCWSE